VDDQSGLEGGRAPGQQPPGLEPQHTQHASGRAALQNDGGPVAAVRAEAETGPDRTPSRWKHQTLTLGIRQSCRRQQQGGWRSPSRRSPRWLDQEADGTDPTQAEIGRPQAMAFEPDAAWPPNDAMMVRADRWRQPPGATDPMKAHQDPGDQGAKAVGR
jgi:hypothetical protein